MLAKACRGEMILACDIGNTNITFAVFKDDLLTCKFSLVCAGQRSIRPYLEDRLKSRSIKPNLIKAAVICSVVPSRNQEIKYAAQGLGIRAVHILGENLKVPIKNRYSRPRQVGQDRLICAYAGMRLYGAPLISVDLGTAITFDAVSRHKEYLGGIILPGLGLSLSALHKHTALLPDIGLDRPLGLIGRTTRQSMLSGVTFGFAGLIDALLDKLKKELGAGTRAVLTGGDALFIQPYCKRIDYLDPDLILKGLAMLV